MTTCPNSDSWPTWLIPVPVATRVTRIHRPVLVAERHRSPVLTQLLTDAHELLGDDGDAYKKAIVDRYPTHIGPFIIDIANRSLFPADN